MSRGEWLIWMARYGNPKTRSKNIGRFFAFELYSLCCTLIGYRISHWLDESPLPAGKYIVIRNSPPLPVRLLDKIFPFGKETHAEYTPYTPEVAEEIRKAGKPVEIRDVSYVLGLEDVRD